MTGVGGMGRGGSRSSVLRAKIRDYGLTLIYRTIIVNKCAINTNEKFNLYNLLITCKAKPDSD